MNQTVVLVIGLLLYSGPLLPFAATLLFRRRSLELFRWNRLLFIVLTALQVLSFVPYVVATLCHNPDALHALFFPAALGLVLFPGSLIILVCECYYFLFGIRRGQ